MNLKIVHEVLKSLVKYKNVHRFCWQICKKGFTDFRKVCGFENSSWILELFMNFKNI